MKDERHDLAITPHRQTLGFFKSKTKHGKNNDSKTKTKYKTKIFKDTYCSFGIRHNYNTRTSGPKTFNR